MCGARPSLVSLSADNRRYRHCPFCGSEEHSDSGCAVCRTGGVFHSTQFFFHGEPGFTIQTCDACKSYVKVVDRVVLSRLSPDLADLISLSLDVSIQEKGYKRTSPNPLGMVRMVRSVV